MSQVQFKFLTYNMAKARSLFRRKYILRNIREALLDAQVDFIFLQEAHGEHPLSHKGNFEQDPLDILTEGLMPYKVYGQNAVYQKGHHGNAILSRHEIMHFENFDVSVSPFARRGLLHCQLDIPRIEKHLHLFCVHMDLLESDRNKQIEMITLKIKQTVKEHDLVLIAGDFNDWRGRLGSYLSKELEVSEVLFKDNKSAKTFPSFFPLVGLDKIFYRGLRVTSNEVLRGRPWSGLSDHLPLKMTFEV